MSRSVGVLCIALLASSARAQDMEVDPSLPSYRPVAGVSGVLGGHSCATRIDLMKVWRAGFQRIYPGAHVELDDDAFEDVGDGAATFGPWVGLMGKHTVGRFKKRFGHAPLRIPVCFFVLAVYVHKDNPLRGGLRVEDVKTIFSPAFRDVTWGDLGCGGKWLNRPIRLYAPRTLTTYFFLTRRCGIDFGYKDSVKRCSNDAAVVASVADDTRGMGLALIGRRTDKVRALTIAPIGSDEFVPTTADNACNGSYPLTDTLYLWLNHDPQGGFELDPLRREFVRYILSKEGQQAAIGAGHVPLSAELAERALAQAWLTPTGKGSWDRMLSRLRARRLPSKLQKVIEGLTRRAGDRPTLEQLATLAKSLANTGLTSSVNFETDQEGATVKYRLIGDSQATTTNRPTKHAKATVPIGLYHVWTERDGKATSPKDAWFQIIREHERIKICEIR